MIKKIKWFILCALMIALFTGCAARGKSGYDVADSFSGGDGTKGNPFQVSNASELRLVAYRVNNELRADEFYVLTDDIYLNDVSDYDNWGTNAPDSKWDAIGIGRAYFYGGFDGNGHTIYGMYQEGPVDEMAYYGFFGDVCRATITDLNIDKAYIVVAGDADVSSALASVINDSKVTNCSYNGVVKDGDSIRMLVSEEDADGWK